MSSRLGPSISAVEPSAPVRVSKSSELIREALALVADDRWRLLTLGVLSVLSAVVEAIVLYLIARAATTLSVDPREAITIGAGSLGFTASLRRLALLAGGVLCVAAGLSVAVARLSASLSQRTLTRWRRVVVGSFLNSSWSHRSQLREGRLQELMNEYCQRSERFVLQFATLIVAISGATILATGAVVVAPVVAVSFAVAAAALAVLVRPLTRRVASSSLALAKANGALAGSTAEVDRVSKEISSFGVEARVQEVVGELIDDSGHAVAGIRFAALLSPALFQAGALGAVTVMIGAVGSLDSLNVEALGPIMLMLLRAMAYVRQAQSHRQHALELAPYAEGLRRSVAEFDEAVPSSGDRTLQTLEEVALVAVRFQYAPGAPVLEQTTLHIEKGEAVGIVGPSGGGKSTLLQLLAGLRSPSEGSVMVNGIDLRDLRKGEWSAIAALVPQVSHLVRGTVADNIRFFRQEVTFDDVVQAAREAHIHDEITALPDGYETVVGPGARDLSGGQKQRVGIARALARRPQLLLLDEPTSALDGRSEELIKVTLESIRGHTTLVLVAHRPSTLQVCDRVLRVEHGVVGA